MMAQDMFEENKVLQAEVDSLKSVIAEHLPLMTEKMRDDFEATLCSLPSSEDYEEEEICEECLMIIEDCECEEMSDG